jgi:hypothetical protein
MFRRRSDGKKRERGDGGVKAASRRRRGRDSARLEADVSALDTIANRSFALTAKTVTPQRGRFNAPVSPVRSDTLWELVRAFPSIVRATLLARFHGAGIAFPVAQACVIDGAAWLETALGPGRALKTSINECSNFPQRSSDFTRFGIKLPRFSSILHFRTIRRRRDLPSMTVWFTESSTLEYIKLFITVTIKPVRFRRFPDKRE